LAAGAGPAGARQEQRRLPGTGRLLAA